MRHILNVLIDEINIICPRLFIQIVYLLCEPFPKNKSTPFGGGSIILTGYVGPFSPVRNKPMYACKTIGKVLWTKFNVIFTLDTILCKQGHDPKQSSIQNILANIRNADLVIVD